MTDISVRRELIRGAWGSLSDWRSACERAKRSGWTLSQVNRLLILCGPLGSIVAMLVIAVVLSAVFGLH